MADKISSLNDRRVLKQKEKLKYYKNKQIRYCQKAPATVEIASSKKSKHQSFEIQIQYILLRIKKYQPKEIE